MIQTVAPSTIAMSATSQLSVSGPLEPASLHRALAEGGLEVTPAAFIDALDQAIERGLIRREGHNVASCLPAGHVVRTRSPLDPTGWEGWSSQPLNVAKEGE
jgi:hypothetical protein